MKIRQSDPVDSASPKILQDSKRGIGKVRGRRITASPAEIAASLHAPVLATFDEFGALIRRSARTVARLEKAGLPVIRPGREPLVLVERALSWIEAGKPSQSQRKPGRPKNLRRGRVTGGAQ